MKAIIISQAVFPFGHRSHCDDFALTQKWSTIAVQVSRCGLAVGGEYRACPGHRGRTILLAAARFAAASDGMDNDGRAVALAFLFRVARSNPDVDWAFDVKIALRVRKRDAAFG